MALNAIHETLDEIPEQYRDLYSERDGKFELTGIQGVKTTADTDRLTESLRKERSEHDATKAKFRPWAELKHDEVMASLDRIPELEAAAADKIDDTKLDEMVERRITTRLAPLERENAELKSNLEEATGQVGELSGTINSTKIKDALRKAATGSKIIDTAVADVLGHERVFELTEDGQVRTKEGVGVTPGLEPDVWLKDRMEDRPHWWPPSKGGGAGGSGGSGGLTGNNPWHADHWNLTEQGKAYNENPDKAKQMAEAVGSHIGATEPAKKPA
jgi:hypothetical protein